MKNNFVSKFLYKFNKPRVEEDKREKLIDEAIDAEDHDYDHYIQGYKEYLERVERYFSEEGKKDV